MDIDKKTIVAFVLIGLILILAQTDLYKKYFVPQPPPPAVVEPPLEQPGMTEPTGLSPVDQTENRDEPPTNYIVAPESRLPIQKGSGDDITVDARLYRAVFSTRGATLKSWELKKYHLANGTPVQMIGEGGYGDLAVTLPTKEDTLDTSPYLFTATKEQVTLSESRISDSIEFTLDLGDNRSLKKRFTFYYDRYDFSLDVEFRNLRGLIDGFSYMLEWKSGLESTEPSLKLDMERARAYVYQGEESDISVSDEAVSEVFDNPTDWVAIRTKYFALAVIPTSEKGQGAVLRGQPVNIGQEQPWKKYGFSLQMPFVQDSNKHDSFTVFLGPLDYDIVKSYNRELEKIMDLGWTLFRPFGRFVLWSFGLLHNVITNYGVVIIIFSILIKILLYPLTRKSYQSMKEMQNLQPKMQEVNEKYKNDPQKKQAEVMKLYKEHGVNPLGGCIPMILQMPLLVALFQVFQSTIELRQAAFILWIQDLSIPDTVAYLPFSLSLPFYGNQVNVLPIFMGVTMFIQQKMTMKDPKQKAMVYFMPIFFTLLFNSFPSGLNLYYAMFNLLTILQEKLIPHKQPEPQKEKPKQAPKRRRKHDYRRRF